jgi:DNA-binding GntR family transcriptional regulator
MYRINAFNQLATEGLINVVPYKGTNVVEITESFIVEVYRIRLQLETLAVELSFPQLGEEDCTLLESYADRMGKLAIAGKFEEVAEIDVRFHKLFYEKSGNSILLEMWNILQSRIQLFQTYGRAYSHPTQSGEVFERHMKFVNAIQSRNLAALTRVVKEHIETGKHLLIGDSAVN